VPTAKLLANASKIYDCFLTMERLAYADGALSKKHKELIGLGIALVDNCESAMQWHVEQAHIAGATFEELLETIEVAIEMAEARLSSLPASPSKSWRASASNPPAKRQRPGR